MCGIVGKINLTGGAVNEADLTKMRDTLTHRGPDDAGLYISPDKTVGLGHRRLAIIDLTSAGHQPMQYKNRYWIVFNGEIYNFQTERQELEKAGYTFKSNSDTEVILALYDKYKEECLQHLRGMFAFAIYDEQEQVLFCARDRAGQKPFKYFYDGRNFLFASELKAILTQSQYPRKPDWLAIHHYLTYQYVPAPQTGFLNIKKLPPAHYLKLDVNNKALELRKYWHLSFTPKQQYSEQEWRRRIETKLDESVQLQQISDVPLGAFLSGGIDSSTIVALMRRHATGPLKTFSIGFEEKALNELPYARQVANHFKTDHTEFMVKPDTIEILPGLVESYEEPYADSSAIPTYYLSQLARKHVTVALNGDAGDENFAGYSRYAFHKLALAFDKLGVSRLPGLHAAGQLFDNVTQSTFSMRAARFLQSLPTHYLRRYVTYHCYFTNEMKRSLYNPIFMQQVGSVDSYDLTLDAAEQSDANRFEQALYADIAMYLPDDLLVKVDIASMASSLEARSPFLDHELMELAASAPAHLKLKGVRSTKYILKQIAVSMLPQAVIRRPKQGFILPIERWFREGMNSYLRSMLLNSDTRITREIVKKDAIEKLISRHTKTNTNLAPQLWSLLTLELWLRRYFP